MTQRNLVFVVVNLNINYRRPAVMGDVLNIDSQLLKLGGKSGVMVQRITRDGDGSDIADAQLTFVCIDLHSQKAQPLRWRGTEDPPRKYAGMTKY